MLRHAYRHVGEDLGARAEERANAADDASRARSAR